jgi:hypothetical protein
MAQANPAYHDRFGHDLYRESIGAARAILDDAARRSLDLGKPFQSDELQELSELLRVAQSDHDFVAAQEVASRG